MDSTYKAAMALTEEEQVTKQNIDIASRSTGMGALSQAATNASLGFNHRGAGISVPVNTDNNGFTFFTRPRLNLSYDNIAQDRVLTNMLSNKNLSYARAIRVWLDPVGAQTNDRFSALANTGRISAGLADPECAFIPWLSNYLMSLSGWPDPIVEYFDSAPGIHKETWSMIDGPRKIFSTFDLSGSWRNIAGDPITSLLHAWTTYGLNVRNGVMLPYPESIIENEKDYETRIYRFLMDPSRRFVQKWCATIGFPTSSALGNAFNFSSDSVYNTDNQTQISVGMHCTGAEYQDPILLLEFNQIVAHFNRSMVDGVRERTMRKLSYQELTAMNWYGYPRINPYTFEMEWWIKAADYLAAFGDT